MAKKEMSRREESQEKKPSIVESPFVTLGFILMMLVLGSHSALTGVTRKYTNISRPHRYIAVPSRVAAFERADLEDDLVPIAQQNADRVCRYKKHDRASEFVLDISKKKKARRVRSGIFGFSEKTYSSLDSPWDWEYSKDAYDKNMKTVKDYTGHAATGFTVLAAASTGIAAAFPPTAPVTGPLALILAKIAIGFKTVSSCVDNETVRSFHEPIFKSALKSHAEKRKQTGWFSTLLRKSGHRRISENKKKVPHLVFSQLTCVDETNDSFWGNFMSIFSKKPKLGEIKYSFSPNMFSDRFSAAEYAAHIATEESYRNRRSKKAASAL